MTIYFAAFIGLLIGSFLNVAIYRVPRKLSVLKPARSFCPNCERQISWWENIPVVSWLILKGHCSGCKESISGIYPVVEILSAISAAASYLFFGLTITGVLVYALVATLIVISFIDLEFKIIPNVISYPGIIIGLCTGIISEYTNYFSFPITTGALDSLIGFLVGGGFFYVIAWGYYIATKRIGLGGGDIKLLAMTGSLLGWQSVPQTIVLGSILGSVIGIGAMIFAKTGRHTEIPFGPWLSIGAILYIFADIPLFRL